MDINDAYRVLGLSQGAGKDEVIKRYDILLKKQRMIQQGQKDDSGEEIELKEINQAYNLLMGYRVEEEPAEAVPGALSPIYRKLNLNERKVNNFFHYYKFHILITIIALIFTVTTVKGCITRIPTDFYMTFIGKIYVNYTDIDSMKQKIKTNIPSVKEPEVDVITIDDQVVGEQAYALQMKVITVIAAGDVDLLIMDRLNFERFAKQGTFMNLDDLVPALGIDREKNKRNILSEEGVQGEHLFGVDVGNSSFLKDSKVIGEEKIAAIRVNAKRYDHAVEMLKLLLK